MVDERTAITVCIRAIFIMLKSALRSSSTEGGHRSWFTSYLVKGDFAPANTGSIEIIMTITFFFGSYKQFIFALPRL